MARLLMNYIQHYQPLPLSLVCTSYPTALEASWQQKTAVSIVDFRHSQLLQLVEESLDLQSHWST